MSDDDPPGGPLVPPPGYEPLHWSRGFGRLIGPLYRRVQGRTYALAFQVEEHHTNNRNACHGGMLMAFADMAFGHVLSVFHSAHWITIRLQCDFLAPANVGDWVEGAGEVLGEADGVFTVRGRIWAGERMLMTGGGVFKITGPRA